jgi:hypothetical protein
VEHVQGALAGAVAYSPVPRPVTGHRGRLPLGAGQGGTKTRKGRRVLKLPTGTAKAFKEHRKRRATERLQAGGQWQNHDLVFCREDGTPLDRWQDRREFAVITKAVA